MDFSATAARLVCPEVTPADVLIRLTLKARHPAGAGSANPCVKERNVAKSSFAAIFNQAIDRPTVPKMPVCKAVAFAAGLGLSMLSYPVHAAPSSSGDTVQGLYDALLGTMKNGRTLGQSGRFT